MNVTEGRDASEDEELSVDASRWSVSTLQTSRVRCVLYVTVIIMLGMKKIVDY